jgi:hypothetical protein
LNGEARKSAPWKVQGDSIDEPSFHETATCILEQAPEATNRVGTILCRIDILTGTALDTLNNPLMKPVRREPSDP